MSELQDMLQLRCQHIVVCIQDIFAQILAFCGPNVEIRKLQNAQLRISISKGKGPD